VSLNVAQCQLVDHGKLHMRHGLSAWGNLALWKGVLITIQSAKFTREFRPQVRIQATSVRL
jgi:hypothetical protein